MTLIKKLFGTEKPKEVDPNHLGILVIDMTDYYLQAHDKTKLKLIQTQREVIQLSVQKGYPIYFIEMYTPNHTGETIPELTDLVGSRESLNITKKRNRSAFEKTELSLELKAANISSLFLMGVNAAYCVQETVSDARKKFTVATSRDVIAEGAGKSDGVCFLSEGIEEWYRKKTLYQPRYSDHNFFNGSAPEKN